MRPLRALFSLSGLFLAAAACLAAPASAQPRQSNNPDVYIANRYASAIVRLYASPVADDNWGRDRLNGAVIGSGQRGELRPERGRGCIWDIKVVYQNGREEERRRQELCSMSEVVFDGSRSQLPQQQQGQPPTDQLGVDGSRVQPPPRAADTLIINQGPAVVVSILARRQNAQEWGQDRLGSNTLRPTGRFQLRMPADQGCVWSIRFVFASGDADERPNLDLCATPELTVAGRARPGQVIASSTGFYVSRLGHVLTTFNSVRNCSTVAIARPSGQRIPMVRVAEDAEFDLALFRVPDLVSPVAPFRLGSAGLAVGEKLVIVGYPARRVLGQVAVIESSVAATSGSRGDATRFHFQPGAVDEPWGAPIYDATGLVVGIANDPQFTGRAGTAVQREAISRFLRAHNVEITEVPQGEPRRLPGLQDHAFPVVLPLDCIH